MRTISDLTAAILAGGKSLRFGSPKYQARFRSATLLDTIIEIARDISLDIIVISGRNSISLQKNIPVYHDIQPDCGPLGGIYTALLYAENPSVAILPCDMPLMNPAIYKILRKELSPSHPVAAISHRGLEPLVSIWPKQLSIPTIETNLEKRKFSIYQTLAELRAQLVYIPLALKNYKTNFFSNINYENDLHQPEFKKENNDENRNVSAESSR